MNEIQLTKGMFTVVDESDFDLINQHKWCFADGYAVRRIGKKNVPMHRIIMDAPKNMEVDHINGDKLDNRKLNLRICTRLQNSRNRKLSKNNTSGYHGVIFRKDSNRKNRWSVAIRVNGKRIYRGCFSTAKQAAMIYDELAKDFHGEYATLNFR